jgi:hypothetical protein
VRLGILAGLACALLALAGAGHAAQKLPPQVGVYYFPGWYRGKGDPTNQWSEWRRCIMKTPQPRAVCGFYDDSDPRLWDYYVDWMAGHGVDFVAFDWYYNDGEEALNDSLAKGFLGCESRDKVKFALHWCNHPLGIWHNRLDQSQDKLLAMTDMACARYFKQPNYLRIKGRPVFMIYDVDQLLAFGGFEAVKSSLKEMRGRARHAGLGGLHMVAVYSKVSAGYVQLCRDLGFDSFCAYTYAGTRHPPVRWDSLNIPYESSVASCVENVYPFLSRIGRERGIVYWPTAFSGWDDRPRAGVEKAFVTEGNTPERFGEMFRGALKYADPAMPIVMVEAWNEWGEGACIEPDKQYGFGYLEQMAQALGRKPAKPRVPSQEEVTSWSVLSPEEVAAAKAIEAKPWEPKKPIYLKLGQNRSVPRAKLPLTLDLGQGRAEVRIGGGKIERRDAEGLLFVSESKDPQVYVSMPETPINQIKRITLYAEAGKDSAGPVPIELFFLTALYPESSSFCWVQLGPLRSGKLSVATSDIMGWSNFGTPLTGIRIDPGEKPGAKVLLQGVTVE